MKDKIAEHFRKIETLHKQIEEEVRAMGYVLEDATGGRLSTCPYSAAMPQVWADDASRALGEIMPLIEDIADDGNIVVRWKDERYVSLGYLVDGHATCTLIDRTKYDEYKTNDERLMDNGTT